MGTDRALAGVSRMAFYQYFDSKDDTRGSRLIFRNVNTLIPLTGKYMTFPLAGSSPETISFHFFAFQHFYITHTTIL